MGLYGLLQGQLYLSPNGRESDWGNLVPRIYVKNSIKLRFLLE
jgi:hypothetical protein